MSKVLDAIAREETKVDMTPMIDVTFLLILFFLFNLRFQGLEGKLAAYLPQDAGLDAIAGDPIERVEVVISVAEPGQKVYADDPGRGTPWGGERDRRFEFVGRRVAYQVGPRQVSELAEVARLLRDLHDKSPDRPAAIDCRAGVVTADVIPVLDLALEAQYDEVTFVGESAKPARK